MTTETIIDVRYPDCDPMNIVHHAVYPIWYEIARMDFFDRVGFPWRDMHELGIDPVMVNLNLEYLAPVRYPGTVTVKTRAVQCEGKKIRLRYECFCAGQCVNRAESFHIWARELKSLRLDEALPAVYARLAAAVEA